MKRGALDELAAFTTVAAEGRFTRTAGRLGLSQSALSLPMLPDFLAAHPEARGRDRRP